VGRTDGERHSERKQKKKREIRLRMLAKGRGPTRDPLQPSRRKLGKKNEKKKTKERLGGGAPFIKVTRKEKKEEESIAATRSNASVGVQAKIRKTKEGKEQSSLLNPGTRKGRGGQCVGRDTLRKKNRGKGGNAT